MSFTYLQEQDEASSGDYCWDTDPCALLNMINTPDQCCCKDKEMVFSQDFQYGTTCQPSTERGGETGLMLSVGGSLAKTSAAPEREKGLMEKEVAFGEKCEGLFMKYDLNTSLLKTHHCLWEEVLQPSCVTLPKWGMMQGGVFLAQHPLAVGIYGKDAGCWPTPLKEEGPGGSHKKLTDAVAIREGYKPRYYKEHGMEGRLAFTGKVNPEWAEWLMGCPMGWTNDLQELEIGKFLLWLRQHGLSLIHHPGLNKNE